MWVGFQRQQTFLVTTERALWRHDKAFLFVKQSEVDFGIAHVHGIVVYFIQDVTEGTDQTSGGCSLC